MEATFESLQTQLKEAEAAVVALEEDKDDEAVQQEPKPMERLLQLEYQVTELELLQKLIEWANRFSKDDDDTVPSVEALETLRRLLSQYDETETPLVTDLWKNEYEPLHAYIRSHHSIRLRRLLLQAEFPAQCEHILQEWDDETADCYLEQIRDSCQALHRLRSKNEDASVDVVTRELCRPFVERVRFHFVEEGESNRATTKRIDRLPEWLFQYVKQHILNDSVWEFIQEVTGRPDAFLHEILRLLQWVLAERNFFRHPLIVGDESKPVLLNNAIEEILQMDLFFQTIAPQFKLIRLMDVCVAGDEELLDWWLENEKSAAFHTLFSEEIKAAPSHVSPRAELFCACIRSIRTKASVFSFRGPYLSQVASPLCMHFLEAIRESADDLNASQYPRWIEIINGTNMAAELLTSVELEEEAQTNNSDAGDLDLLRFGKSLLALRDVLVDDFSKTFVERVLMEKAKLASYLMRSPFIVASCEDEEDEIHPSIEVLEVCRILQEFYQATKVDDLNLQFASQQMRERVVSILVKKFLTVALDSDGMTPELVQAGSASFARNVQSILDIFTLLPPDALRLIDITNFMTMGKSEISGIGNALCGLSGLPAPLMIEPFEDDDRLAEEAVAMIQAKGYLWITLADVLSVLNRRSDLGDDS